MHHGGTQLNRSATFLSLNCKGKSRALFAMFATNMLFIWSKREGLEAKLHNLGAISSI